MLVVVVVVVVVDVAVDASLLGHALPLPLLLLLSNAGQPALEPWLAVVSGKAFCGHAESSLAGHGEEACGDAVGQPPPPPALGHGELAFCCAGGCACDRCAAWRCPFSPLSCGRTVR